MIFQRIKSEGLAHNSYLVGSRGQAFVVDPRRDVDVYIDMARVHRLQITHIFETHRNEDYIIGSLDLGRLTGASVHHGPGIAWKYGNTLTDGQQFEFGNLRLSVLHTPGHTDESASYVLTDLSTGPGPVMVFTGDTLFVGDVGRADLYGPDQVSRLAGNMYHSIFDRLLPLGDGTIICPAHGSGSACGHAIAERDDSTIGIERRQNPWLSLDKEEFVRRKTAEKMEFPPYFREMERVNLEGPRPVSVSRLPGLDPQEFERAVASGALVLDASHPPAFCGAHVEGAYSIWLEGLSSFAGWVLPYDRAVLMVLERESDLDRAARQLVRIGYDRMSGYLKGGIEGWYDAGMPFSSVRSLPVHELKKALESGQELIVLDVRSQEEWDGGHIPGALHVFVGHLQDKVAELPAGKPLAVLCNVGRRASLAVSILLRSGRTDVYNVLGSMTAWRAAGYSVVRD